ncbi:MAG: DNA-binding protein [Tissierellia bacterium]|nr:DNA-binding protein [Tissierellia bacterium]
MEYRRFDNTIMLRVDYGEELVSSIEKVCREENVKLATVAGIGAFDSVEIGVYDVPTRNYEILTFNQFFELTSLLGNITTKDGDFYGHYHVTIGDEEGVVMGGHLKSGIIGGTGEIAITILDGTIERQKCDITGINVFKF